MLASVFLRFHKAEEVAPLLLVTRLLNSRICLFLKTKQNETFHFSGKSRFIILVQRSEANLPLLPLTSYLSVNKAPSIFINSLPQCSFQNLACGVLWQFVHGDEPSWYLVRCQVFQQVVADRIFIEWASIFHDNVGPYGLAS